MTEGYSNRNDPQKEEKSKSQRCQFLILTNLEMLKFVTFLQIVIDNFEFFFLFEFCFALSSPRSIRHRVERMKVAVIDLLQLLEERNWQYFFIYILFYFRMEDFDETKIKKILFTDEANIITYERWCCSLLFFR